MKRWIGLIVLAVLLWGAATFGLAALAVEWRGQGAELGQLSDDVTGLKTGVEELREQLGLPGEGTPAPASPTPTPQPITVEAKVGVEVKLRGMTLTVASITPFYHAGHVVFGLQNVDAPAEEARADALEWKAEGYNGFLCDLDVQALDVTLEPGEKVEVTVFWDCTNPGRWIQVDNAIFTLPVVPRPAPPR